METTVKIISSSDLFASLPRDLVNELWDSCPFSFGDCCYSLVNAHDIQCWLRDLLADKEDKRVNEFMYRLNHLTENNIFIDLES